MADKKKRAGTEVLPTWTRCCAAALGLLLITLAALMVTWCFPTAYEWKGDGTLVKSTRAVSDLSGVVTALLLAGVGLLAFALNGVRMLEFGAGSLHFDARPEVKSTKQEQLADVPGAGTRPLRKGDVPIQVVADALSAWPPDAGDPPSTVDQFESAWRHEGRGPHPWFLKFKNRPVVRVFYGGRGRTGPHVSSPEPD